MYTGEMLRTVVPTRVSLMIHVFPVLHPPPRTTIICAREDFQHYTVSSTANYLPPNDRTNHVYIDIIGLNEPYLEHYHIFPVNDDVLSASASPNYVTYATYANNFKTPSIVTTTTSLVFYFYESNKLSTNEHTTSAFHQQLSWTMTIIVIAAYVLMIAASGILLQTKFGNFYMSTQWSMESIFVKLLLVV